MKKMFCFSLLISILAPWINFAEKIMDLPQILKPVSISANGDLVYIVENSEVKIFSLKDQKHIKQFGKKGEGPGEFRFSPSIFFTGENLLINSLGKVCYFSPIGQFLREFKTTGRSSRYMKINNGYLARKHIPAKTKGRFLQSIGIFNEDLSTFKEIYSCPLPGMIFISSNNSGKQDMQLVNDYISYQVFGDRIYIADSSKGFYVAVFDPSGKKVNSILKEMPRIKFTEKDKQELLEREKSSPYYERFKDMFNYTFPEFFPAIYQFYVSGEKLYLLTYKKQGGLHQLIILNSNGDQLKEQYIPVYRGGHNPFIVIDNEKLYYLKENDDEMWELHQVQL